MHNSIRTTVLNSVRLRWYSTMSQPTAISPFSQAVVNAMRKLYVYNTMGIDNYNVNSLKLPRVPGRQKL